MIARSHPLSLRAARVSETPTWRRPRLAVMVFIFVTTITKISPPLAQCHQNKRPTLGAPMKHQHQQQQARGLWHVWAQHRRGGAPGPNPGSSRQLENRNTHQQQVPHLLPSQNLLSHHQRATFVVGRHQARSLNDHHQYERALGHINPLGDVQQQRAYLPSGPPPFRPSSLALGLNSMGALEKLKGTKVFKRMYKSRAYYLFLDVLEQLALLVDNLAKHKIELLESQVAAVQAVAQRFVMKGSQLLKLKWPLVMLNPHFIKEILSNPTLLVMLFHAIEVAYMSMPASFWLKPLVKLVKQPTPEKEEEVWWRRKRIYEVLNGPGSSELQPNLKTKHFRQPGEPAPPLSLASLTQAIRQFSGRPALDPNYYSYPPSYGNGPAGVQMQHPHLGSHLEAEHSIPISHDVPGHFQQDPMTHHQHHHPMTSQWPRRPHHHEPQLETETPFEQSGENKPSEPDGSFMSQQQAKAFLANQHKGQFATSESSHEPYGHEHDAQITMPGDGHATGHLLASGTDQVDHFGPAKLHSELHAPPSSAEFDVNHFLAPTGQALGAGPNGAASETSKQFAQPPPPASPMAVMSQLDFDMLDPREKELILEETRKSHMEERLADELIRQQSEFVDSIVQRQDGVLTLKQNLVPLGQLGQPAASVHEQVAAGPESARRHETRRLDSDISNGQSQHGHNRHDSARRQTSG